MAHHRTYWVEGGRFIKAGIGNPIAEYEKVRQLYDVSTRCGFRAPKALSFDSNRDRVELEFLSGLRSIRSHYISYLCSPKPTASALDVISEAGRVLASIHKNLSASGCVPWEPPSVFLDAYRDWNQGGYDEKMVAVHSAPLHCDYGFSNVCVLEGAAGSVVTIIDPAGNGFVTFRPNLFGPVYVDIANFMTCIEGLIPLRFYATARWARLQSIRDAFLSGYSTSGFDLSGRVISSMVYATAVTYFYKRFGKGRRHRLALSVLFNSWKGNAKKRVKFVGP